MRFCVTGPYCSVELTPLVFWQTFVCKALLGGISGTGSNGQILAMAFLGSGAKHPP